MSSRSLSSRFFWRPVAGALLLTVPALVLVPGCGGGSDSNEYYTLTGVELMDGNEVVSRANLSVTFNGPSTSPQSSAGYLQVLNLPATPVPSATTTGTPNATTTATATATTTATTTPLRKKVAGRNTRALPGDFIPTPALYQIRGTSLVTSSTAAPIINLSGAFSQRQKFTITGTFARNQTLTLTATFTETNGEVQTGTLNLKVLPKPFDTAGTATPIPTGTPTITGTPTTTGTPTATTTGTPFATITPTFFATPTATSTTAPINTLGPL